MDIIQKVKEYIKQHDLLSEDSKIIVGVSGGSDSVALLDILVNLGYKCIIAHCNFHLRGEESYRDEYFVSNLAKKYNLEFVFTHFDTKKHVEDGSMSVEMAARELRYAWFEKIRTDLDADFIAVAHHMDDSIETVLMNMVRGTGIKGLTGIPVKNGYVVRPLLGITHDEISDYLNDKGLTFVTDSTNLEDIYTRNKIRLSVIPLLETINPSVKEALNRMSSNLKQVENIYLSYMDKAKKKVFSNNKINIAKLLQQKEPKTILFEILFSYGFNSDTVDNIFDSIEAQSGKIFYSEKYRLIKDREFFILDNNINNNIEQDSFIISEFDDQINASLKLSLSVISNVDFEIEKNKNILFADKDKIKFPLIVRKWSYGDWFIPFGMKGKKKLSDYFTDKKYSITDKENIWILCSGNDIVWIIGERADERFKITEQTKEILKIILES